MRISLLKMPKFNVSVFLKDYPMLFQSLKHDLNSRIFLALLELRFSVNIFVGSGAMGVRLLPTCTVPVPPGMGIPRLEQCLSAA